MADHNPTEHEHERVAALAAELEHLFGPAPELAAVLGSGWSAAVGDLLGPAATVATPASWPRPTILGHAVELRRGALADRQVLICGGRVHAYEGHPARVLVRGVRALARWGVRGVLLLNAAGSLRPEIAPGGFLLLRDHLRLGMPDPNAADQTESGTAVFLDSQDLYDGAWRAALRANLPGLAEGIYAGVPGPSYETPAEIAMLQAAGAHVVGMSTVPEVLAARAAGMRVAAVSLVTNYAAGVAGGRPEHGEVLTVAARHAKAAAALVTVAVAAAPAI
ncbi:MAG TPA: purine-nucleoside phosphorylase [Planctomycetota bacterium]